MSGVKIFDKLSGDEILISEVLMFCTNPDRESDTWHNRNEMVDDYATKILYLYNLPYAKYQVYALIDDGRSEGSVWFPVTITRSKQT